MSRGISQPSCGVAALYPLVAPTASVRQLEIEPTDSDVYSNRAVEVGQATTISQSTALEGGLAR